LLQNESSGKVSAVSVQSQARETPTGFSALSMAPLALFGLSRSLCGVNPGASITPKCARLHAQGQRVSGPGAKMARRRYQKGSPRLRGKVWTLRWREDVVLADGTVKREQRTTVVGTLAEFPTNRLVEREAASFLARVNRFDYRPVKRTAFGEFAENWKSQVIDLLKPSTAKVMASHLRFHLR